MKTPAMRQLIALPVFLLLSLMVHAQDDEPKGELSVNYHIASPMGDFQDFQPDNSYRGFSIDYYYKLKNGLQVGGLLGWHIFHKKYPRKTYEFENGAVTMKQWHYSHIVPLVGVLRYGLWEDEPVSVYFGVGTGAFFVRQEIWAGLDEFVNEDWRYGLFPELGIKVKATDKFGFTLGSKYYFVVDGQNANDENKHLYFWDFNLGAYLKL